MADSASEATQWNTRTRSSTSRTFPSDRVLPGRLRVDSHWTWEGTAGGVTTEVAPIELYFGAPRGLRGFTVRDPDGNLISISREVHSPEREPSYHALT